MRRYISAWQQIQIHAGNICQMLIEVYQLEVVTGDLFATLTKITAFIRADADMMGLVND